MEREKMLHTLYFLLLIPDGQPPHVPRWPCVRSCLCCTHTHIAYCRTPNTVGDSVGNTAQEGMDLRQGHYPSSPRLINTTLSNLTRIEKCRLMTSEAMFQGLANDLIPLRV